MERLFNLDAQLIFDACTLAIAMFVLFTFLSYMLFEPVRNVLEKRRQAVADEQENAAKDREEAALYKAEYEKKLKEIDKEAEQILSAARKKAMQNEAKLIAGAKKEAARILARADAQIEQERRHALDDMKQEMISIASMMAAKAVSSSMDVKVQEELLDKTLKEMGENTWQS